MEGISIQSIGLALKHRDLEGEPLPGVFQKLENMGAKVRRGQVTLIAGAPGGGKTALASYFALHTTVPGLYFSADSDKLSFGKSAVASVLDIHVNEAERLLTEGDKETWDKLSELTSHLWVSFQAAPSPRDIREEVDAYAHYMGDYPAFIIVDNLMDVEADLGDERVTQDAIINFLKQLARETGSAVIILCHVTGQYTDGLDPIPRSGLMNKIDKRPRLILTLWRVASNILGVAVVKNTNGRAESDASFFCELPWMPEMAWIGTKAD